MKLTKDSVYRSVIDGDGNVWEIAAKVPNLDFGYVGIMNEGTTSEYRAFFSAQGRRFGFDKSYDSEPTKKTLVSLYTPPRTLEEVAGDMAEKLKLAFYTTTGAEEHKLALLAEYEAIGGEA